ncbi:hypothetical protein Vafri_1924 [Volvox africanus]|nr:hypothetical protein Vafri_1924 [Volvox africanus]
MPPHLIRNACSSRRPAFGQCRTVVRAIRYRRTANVFGIIFNIPFCPFSSADANDSLHSCVVEVVNIFTGYRSVCCDIKFIGTCMDRMKKMSTKSSAGWTHFATLLVTIVAALLCREISSQQISIDTGKSLPKVDAAIVIGVWSEYKALFQTLDPSPAPYNLTKFGRSFTIGSIAGRTVVLAPCGIGLSNSAMTTQMVIDTFNVQYLLMQGVAGGIDPDLKVGDVVVPRSWFNVQHQRMIRSIPSLKTKKPTNAFYAIGRDSPNKFVLKGSNPVSLTAPLATTPSPSSKDLAAITAIPNAGIYSGFAIPMETEVLVNPGDVFQDDPPTKFFMPVSKTLWNIAKQVQDEQNVTLLRSATVYGEVKDLGYTPQLVVTTNPGASSSTYLDNKEYREELYRLFKAQAFEMEGSGFMHVCVSANKDCLVIRSLSDLAGGNADYANVIKVFLGFASKNNAAVTKAIISRLP